MNRLLILVGIFLLSLIFLINKKEIKDSNSGSKMGEELTGKDIWLKQLEKKRARRETGYRKMDQPDLYQKFHEEIRTREGASGPEYPVNYKVNQLEKLQRDGHAARTNNNGVIDFTPRGPSNVPGRTRGLLVLPGDPNKNTWLAGSAGGGIWKTTDAGQSWQFLTPDFPTMAVSTLAMSEVDANIIYAGTGEFIASSGTAIDGQGIFKSTDGGVTWDQLPSTANTLDFLNITRIIVDPDNPELVLSASAPNNWRRGPEAFLSTIMRSEDGGDTWSKVMEITIEMINNREATGAIEQLIATPGNFNILYASMHGMGPWKSTDAGLTWAPSNNGMSAYGRVELAVSPVKTDRLFASAEGSLSGTSSDSDLYISDDGGERWSYLASEINDVPVDFLGGQGWYDNTIACDPYNADIVYAGGVGLFRFRISSEQRNSYSLEMENLNFMQFVNFGADYQAGMLEANEFAGELSVEIRFGPGKTQKAHRYLVPENATSGVPPEEYFYQDYVDVPFEVWDITSNRQLMVGFRDQGRDGQFDLKHMNTEETTQATQQSREYIYIADIEYSTTPNEEMAKTGGHEHRNMFFFWPVLSNEATWDPNNLPESTLLIAYKGKEPAGVSTLTSADVYGQYDGKNRFLDIGDLHPDQHNMVMIPVNTTEQTYKILLSNDGGVFYSKTAKEPGTKEGDWIFAGHGYNTTQFYGAQKIPGGEAFIGGAQDNGTWHSPVNSISNDNTEYEFAIGGDGFEVLWHALESNKMIGGSQFNNFMRSLNKGSSWHDATAGLSGNNPFISKLANSDDHPEVIYTLSSDGVFRSDNFGTLWELTPITENWLSEDVTSTFLDVEVSVANANIIWAGCGMASDRNLHYSVDGGKTFQMATNYSVNMGTISRLGSHPHEDSTAYALFSFAKSPKVLRTTDLGQTWEDISGFEINDVSNNGFPDVAIYCIYVRPDNPDIIWVGSEIGIIESLDNGQSWHILETFPNASVWQFHGRDNFITIATHGRGIWTAQVEENQGTEWRPVINMVARMPNGKIIAALEYPQNADSAAILVDNQYIGSFISSGLQDTVIISGNLPNAFNFTLLAYEGSAPIANASRIILGSVKDPVSSFYSTFKTASPYLESEAFIREEIETGSKNIAYNSPHNYPDNSDLIVSISSPLIVSESNPVISYDDIAIIQPEDDYVVVEGTIDGLNWVPLTPAYDATYNSQWLSLYNSGENPDHDHFVQHEIDLTNTFNVNDTIFVRFRLHSDETINAWGWAIDNLFVQREVVAIERVDDISLSIYPNPVRDNLHVHFGNNFKNEKTLAVIDMAGKTWIMRKTSAREENINVSKLPRGTYILTVEDNNQRNVKKFIIQR